MKRKNVIITILASVILFGYAYNLDILQALQGPFRDQPFNFSSTQFNLLYFFTFLPTVFIDIPIGIIIDKNPLKVSMYTLLLISLIAQISIALVLQFMVSNYILVMYGMRSLFGIAGQGMFTVQGVIVAKYAKSDYQIMMGLCLSLPFLMDSVNSAVTTAVFDATGYMALPWYIGAVVCLISLLAAVYLHKKFLKAKQQKIQDLKQKQRKQQASSQQIIQQQFNFKSLKTFKFQFWVLIGAIFFFESSLGPFVDNLNDLIVKRFGIAYATTGKLLLIPFGLLAPISFLINVYCSKKPNVRRDIILCSCALYFLSMDLMYILPNTDTPTFVYYLVVTLFLTMMSFLFAVYYSVVVSSLPYVVEQKSVGTAFGVCGCAIALAQCLVPIGNMQIMSQAGSLVQQYQNLNLFGLFLSFIPIIFAIWIKADRFKALDKNLSQQSPKKKIQQAYIDEQINIEQPGQNEIKSQQKNLSASLLSD